MEVHHHPNIEKKSFKKGLPPVTLFKEEEESPTPLILRQAQEGLSFLYWYHAGQIKKTNLL